MKQMRIKHNETGRSMVEMLGVLAIMGVLSIGGVAGYRYAVDKMNANEIINELKKRAITASQQRILSQNINLSEYGAILGKYEVTPANGYPEDPAFFGLEIKAVPQKVCQHIVDSDWAMPTEMKIGNLVMDKDTECPDEFNDISFAFHNTLDQTQEIGEIITPPEQPTQKCEAGYYPLPDGTCKEDTKCSDPNQFWNGNEGKCTSCPTKGNPVRNNLSDIEDSCPKCANAQVGGYDQPFYCVWCPSNRVVCGDTCCGEGQQCKYEYSSSTNWNYVYTCVDSLGDNECLTNADCNNGSETGDYYCQNAAKGCGQMIGTCQPATLYNNGATLPVGTTTVVRSADRMGWYAAKNFCAAHNMSLFNPKPYCTTDEWSHIQSNGEYGSCAKLDVTDDSSWKGWTGISSASCSAFFVYLADGYVSDDGYPYALCEGEGGYVPPVVSTEVTTQTETVTVSPEVSGGGQCGSGEFMSNGGTCFSCSESNSYSSIEDECKKCDDTSTPRTMYGGAYCGLKSCPSGKVMSANGSCALPCGSGQFMSNYGSCYSCSDSIGYPTTAAECAKCNNTSTPRYMSGDFCVRR